MTVTAGPATPSGRGARAAGQHSSGSRVVPDRQEPRGRLFGRAPRRHAADAGHTPWCVRHGESGCEGQVFSLPGTQLLVWLSAPSAGDPRLVVEGPGGVTQLPVDA